MRSNTRSYTPIAPPPNSPVLPPASPPHGPSLRPEPPPSPLEEIITPQSTPGPWGRLHRTTDPRTILFLEPLDENSKCTLLRLPNARYVSWSRRGVGAMEIGTHLATMTQGSFVPPVLAAFGRDGLLCDLQDACMTVEVLATTGKDIVLRTAKGAQPYVRFVPTNSTPLAQTMNRTVLLLDMNETYDVSLRGDKGQTDSHFRLVWGISREQEVARAQIANLFSIYVSRQLMFHRQHLKSRNYNWPDRAGDMKDYELKKELEVQGSGILYEAMNPRSRHYLAVKKVEHKGDHVAYKNIVRELTILSVIKHTNIVEVFGVLANHEDLSNVRIFMPLQFGTLATFKQLPREDRSVYIAPVTKDVLTALDFLHSRGIVHGNVQPEHVCFHTDGSRLVYQLYNFDRSTTFGLPSLAHGAPPFAAPEHLARKGVPMAASCDSWSLFATLLVFLGDDAFDIWLAMLPCTAIPDAIVRAAAETLPALREMARLDPDKRATPAQMLLKLFDGDGLSSERDEVPPLRIDVAIDAFWSYEPPVPAASGQHNSRAFEDFCRASVARLEADPTAGPPPLPVSEEPDDLVIVSPNDPLGGFPRSDDGLSGYDFSSDGEQSHFDWEIEDDDDDDKDQEMMGADLDEDGEDNKEDSGDDSGDHDSSSSMSDTGDRDSPTPRPEESDDDDDDDDDDDMLEIAIPSHRLRRMQSRHF